MTEVRYLDPVKQTAYEVLEELVAEGIAERILLDDGTTAYRKAAS